jgi:hypothetical protein
MFAVENIGCRTGIINPVQAWQLSNTLIMAARPREIQDYWTAAYPEIDTAGATIRILMESGYTVMGFFTLPAGC